VQRAVTKATSNYVNPSWDLVDAVDSTTVSLAEVDREELPPEARGLSTTELETWVDGKRKQRQSLKTQLAELAKARAEHVAAQAAQAGGPARLDTAIVESILAQARDAGFTIEPAA
jgi:pyrrolidone-carboxylate peptidase